MSDYAQYAVTSRTLATLWYLSVDSTQEEPAWTTDRNRAIKFSSYASAQDAIKHEWHGSQPNVAAVRLQPLDDSDLRFALHYNFGAEWDELPEADKALIIRDCTEEGGVQDIQQYRRSIGAGHLESYVKCQRVRFAHK